MTDRPSTDGSRPGAGPPAKPISRGRNSGLDGLRVVAAFAVLVTHVGGQTGFEFTGSPASWVVNRGDVGVPIFFALSGLLLYRPWARAALDGEAGPHLASYLCRRALRILPAYWLVVVICLVTFNRGHIGSASTWLQYLLLLQNYSPHPWWSGSGAQGLAQMWSLVVEVSFYALLPLLSVLLDRFAWRGTTNVGRRAKRLLAGIGALGLFSYAFAVAVQYPLAQLWLDLTLPRLMTWFAAGMALAVLAEWARAEPSGGAATRFCATIASSAGACWLIAALVFVIACTPIAGPETLLLPSLWNVEVKTALYTVVAAALVAPVAFQPVRPTWVAGILGNPVMRFLGKISYGMFLWQFVAIYGLYWLVGAHTIFQGVRYPWPIMLAILIGCAVGTVAVAAASYYLIEAPAQRLYRVVYRPRSRRRAVSQPAAGNPGDRAPDPAPTV